MEYLSIVFYLDIFTTYRHFFYFLLDFFNNDLYV